MTALDFTMTARFFSRAVGFNEVNYQYDVYTKVTINCNYMLLCLKYYELEACRYTNLEFNTGHFYTKTAL